jgi:outer membrane protein assembly factor BamB
MNEKIGKNKTIATTFVIILALSAILAALPSTLAQQSGTRQTYPFLGAVPNPVGKDQTVLFHVGIFQQLSSAQMGWEGLTITIEKPDGTTDTISDIKTDSTGGTGKTYTPDQVGTYYCQTHFPQQEITETKTVPGIDVGTVMLASESAVLELEVQEEAVQYYPDNPLPDEYWTRPIDAQLRSWYAVTGNWLDATETAPQVVSGNGDAPETAHILWAKPLTMGGLAGAVETSMPENSPEWSFSHGDAYEGKWTTRLIIDGILIYSHRTNDRPLYYTAVDVRTGEELWKKVLLDNQTIAFAQNLIWSGYNHHAVYPYFWVTAGSDWYAFDPLTGEWEFTITNVPAGTTITDEQGWLYRLNLDFDTGEGYLWSMVDLIEPFGQDSPHAGSWLPAGSFYGARPSTYNATEMENGVLTEAAKRAYISEFTFAADHCPGGDGVIRGMAFGDKVFGLEYSTTEINTWAISLEDGNEGTLLFSETWAAPADWAAGQLEIEFNAISLEDGAAVIWTKDTLEYYAFSTNNGQLMWGPSNPEYYMNYYGWTELGERPPFIWEGKLYSTGAGGHIYCYDLTDGHVIWDHIVEDPYQEYLFANNWWQFFLFIVDGKLYSAHMEHSAIEPMPRGAPFLCLDATSGDLIWQADGLFRSSRWGGRAIIGDSVIVGMDTYDNRLYAIGRGKSALTVEKPLAAVTKGSAVTLQGTVMDVSPGTNDVDLQIRFPTGVPAVSDASMSDWMLYVYKQFARPTDATGVTVKIEVVNPDNEYEMVGTTTSDSYGNWAFGFCPDVPGTYMVIATFEGSRGYYGSASTTYLTVASAASGANVLTLELAIVLAIIVMVVVCIVVYLLTRRTR